MLVKIKEFLQKDNDIYFFQIVSDKIIINDNYVGVLILDSNLNLIKRLTIFDGITVYSSFFNNSNEEILLFCPDNECIVYVNIRSYEYSVIHLENGLENLVFSTLYEWNDNGLILTTYNSEFYSICLSKKSMKKISDEEIATKYTELYKLFQEARKHKTFKMLSDGSTAIIDYDNHNINIINHKNQIKHVFDNASIDFLDIDYRKGILAIVNENAVEIMYNNGNVVMYPEEDYIFLKGRILDKFGNPFLITLSSSKLDINKSRIEMFQIMNSH